MSNVTSQLEMMTRRECRLCCRKDAELLSTQPSLYERDNTLAYYVACNTWIMIVSEVSQFGAMYLQQYIIEHGLVQTIRVFDDAATAILRGDPVEFGLAVRLQGDICQLPPRSARVAYDPDRMFKLDPAATVLQIFRYLKRFSPKWADRLNDESYAAFEATQARLKDWQRRPLSRYVSERVKSTLRSLLDWDALCTALEKFEVKDFVFTSGVNLDAGADLLSKLEAVNKRYPEYFRPVFGLPLVSLPLNVTDEACAYLDDQSWGKQHLPIHLVGLTAVPKNYKKARIIAPEAVVRQAQARWMFDTMDRYTPSEISLHDQSVNQGMALQGSIDGLLATLDMSDASNSMTWTLFGAWFPPRFYRAIQAVLPTHYYIGKDPAKRRILQSAATMGNAITFWLESVIFLAIAKAAVEEFNLLTGASDARLGVFGDDLVVPTDSAELVIEWLEACGFVINRDKSWFSESIRYRESCGEEYMLGVRLSSVYYPRFPIVGRLAMSGPKFGHSLGAATQKPLKKKPAKPQPAKPQQPTKEPPKATTEKAASTQVPKGPVAPSAKKKPVKANLATKAADKTADRRVPEARKTAPKVDAKSKRNSPKPVKLVGARPKPIATKAVVRGPFVDYGRKDNFTGEIESSLSSLVDLQHKMFYLSQRASLFVAEVIRELEPRMTTSIPEDGMADIWEYMRHVRPHRGPHAPEGKPYTEVGGPGYREMHLVPRWVPKSTKAKSQKGETLDSRRLLVYNYQRFLIHGPEYADPLDKILGITMPPKTLEEASNSGRVVWVYADRP